MTIQQYFDRINHRFQSGISTEHSYRGDLQLLLETFCDNTDVTNEPTRIACGAPDYIITKQGNANFPIGYIEAKDLIESLKLDTIEKSEQLVRYRASLSNLFLTNYIDFRLFLNGEKVTDISIAKIEGKKLIPLPENWGAFENLIKDFSQFKGISIKSAPKLAEMMASKARLMQNVLQEALESDEKTQANSSLKDQMAAFKNILIHDIKPEEFADIYAQTIAYGMFAARLHDTSMDSFTRQEAAELIPKSNPFLKKLFGYIAGVEIDDRIIWIIEALAEVFRAADVAAILKNFGKATRMEDPMIHFYETFLAAYNPKLRKSRGVWYTPEPVVNFIVRAVDDILKTEFGLPMGLADNSKIKIKRKAVTKATTDKRSKIKETEIEEEVHKVQILDPATGTGTFLAEVIRQVYSNFEGQQGIWSNYAEDHLIPRLHGFEILMASYAMAHLKLDLLLKQTGYVPSKKENRLRVYLTNSLEEAHPDTSTLWANFLSQEASEANAIKRETPVMVVIGNPPYSGESQNKGSWIMDLMEDYKKEPGGKEKLKERNSKWVNADENKFIRFGQHFIQKNGEGILGYINPHSFLDNPTLRGMRWNLLKTFDKIYILDLHGNSIKKEISPDGSIDQNVFDITQGVTINLFIKTGRKKGNELAKIFHFDQFGKREVKYNFLTTNSLSEISFTVISAKPPMYFWTNKNFEVGNEYINGFLINDLFLVNGNGMTTAHDEFVINHDKERLLNTFVNFQNTVRDKEELHSKFNVKKKTGWDILQGYDNIKNVKDLSTYIKPVSYRPFDNKYIFYEDKLVWRTVRKVMTHLFDGFNTGLVVGRQGQVVGSMQWNLVFVTNAITDFNFYYRGGGVLFPLYLYPENTSQQTIDNYQQRQPNLNKKIVSAIVDRLGLAFTNEKETTPDTFAPVDILDYIYAILHCSSYREKYKEFLKTDFPRIPYPKNLKTFRELTILGSQLRQIHLLESPNITKQITKYPINGDNVVEKIKYADNKIFINETQYFEGVSEIAWNFYIGGYQPTQKWLKDRKGRRLSFEDIMHYQKIIVALTETDRIMKDINKIEFA